MDKLPDHLGGHNNVTHTDRGTLAFLKEQYGIKSFVDIGCGVGEMVQVASDRGLISIGIDGDWIVERNSFLDIRIHDYTTGPYKLQENWKQQEYPILAWCVEFLEHVEEKYMDNYFATMLDCDYVVCTHAVPGQDGHHHVNCKPQDYWIEEFTKRGFTWYDITSRKIREISTMRKPFMQHTGLFFANNYKD